jgi:hypothetical protein
LRHGPAGRRRGGWGRRRAWGWRRGPGGRRTWRRRDGRGRGPRRGRRAGGCGRRGRRTRCCDRLAGGRGRIIRRRGHRATRGSRTPASRPRGRPRPRRSGGRARGIQRRLQAAGPEGVTQHQGEERSGDQDDADAGRDTAGLPAWRSVGLAADGPGCRSRGCGDRDRLCGRRLVDGHGRRRPRCRWGRSGLRSGGGSRKRCGRHAGPDDCCGSSVGLAGDRCRVLGPTFGAGVIRVGPAPAAGEDIAAGAMTQTDPRPDRGDVDGLTAAFAERLGRLTWASGAVSGRTQGLPR